MSASLSGNGVNSQITSVPFGRKTNPTSHQSLAANLQCQIVTIKPHICSLYWICMSKMYFQSSDFCQVLTEHEERMENRWCSTFNTNNRTSTQSLVQLCIKCIIRCYLNKMLCLITFSKICVKCLDINTFCSWINTLVQKENLFTAVLLNCDNKEDKL